MPTGEYVHLVGTYDGNVLKLYVNGELRATDEIKGAISFPSSPSDYLCIGADSCPDPVAEAGMFGEIAAANVYSFALTDAQVAGLYLARTGN